MPRKLLLRRKFKPFSENTKKSSVIAGLRSTIDVSLAYLKWPTAIISIYLIPAFWGILLDTNWTNESLSVFPFFFGLGSYYLLWTHILSNRWWSAYFETFEHELTHTIFAWITLHRAKIVKVSAYEGGLMQVFGGDNWLITLSPYFFPTLSFIIIFLFSFLGIVGAPLYLLLGASVCYHIMSCVGELSVEQPDLTDPTTGVIFSACIIPAFSAYFYFIILGYLNIGFPSISYINNILLEYLL
jgi:hypothetical protein